MATISLAALRRHVVAWQAFATRFRRATDDDVTDCVRRLACVQLDSIAAVERSHLLVLAAQVGAVEANAVSRFLAAGRLFEYWGHEACLLHVQDWQLLRHRMLERQVHHWWGPILASDPKLAAHILDEIRERGPLGSRNFEGKGGGGMWQLKPAKRMLDALWTAGKLVICGRQGFQRLYDLPERVIGPSVLAAPLLGEQESLRGLIARAIHARGALTAHGILDHYRFKGGLDKIEPVLAALCRTAEIREFAVSDGGPPVYVPAVCDPNAAEPTVGCVLLSPFDNLLWDRAFTRRLFGFNHVIEVYKREHERIYGYYVLPFLFGDRIVGRVDLKSLRDKGRLHVKAVHFEPGIRRTSRLVAQLGRALARLARTLGLTDVSGF